MDSIDSDDQANLRDTLRRFFEPQVERWRMYDRAYIELVKLIQSSHECTTAMHFIPQSLLTGDPVRWLKKGNHKGCITVPNHTSEQSLCHVHVRGGLG